MAFFSWEFPPNIVGGLGIYACNMSRTLAKMGHQIDVFSVNDGSLKTEDSIGKIRVTRPFIKTPPGFFSPILSERWNQWLGGNGFISSVLMYNILAAAKFVDSQSNGGKYDLVVCHDWLAGLAGSLIKENTDIPFIFQLHSTEWGRSQNCPFEPIANIERQAAAIADTIITVSNPMQEHLVCCGMDAKKIRVAWNGIDPEKYSPASADKKIAGNIRKNFGIKGNERMILYIGRLAAEKGALELVAAMSLAKTKIAKLVVVGQGYQEPVIRSAIEMLSLGDKVSLVSRFLTEKERINYYAACDIAAFPSKFEPFGIVCLEAMAMAKPVIVGASGVSGFKDQVVNAEDFMNGCHVDGRNPADIATWGIDRLCGMEKIPLEQYGLNGRQRVIKYFTWKHSAIQTLRIYEEALANNASRKQKSLAE